MMIVILNSLCLCCIESPVFLKIAFVRHLPLFSVLFECCMYGAFALTTPLRDPSLLAVSLCEIKIITYLRAYYRVFGSLNFTLHGLASMLRSSELGLIWCLGKTVWLFFQVTSRVMYIACRTERRNLKMTLQSEKNTLISELSSISKYTDTNISICGTQLVLQQEEKHPLTYKLSTFNGEQHRSSHY